MSRIVRPVRAWAEYDTCRWYIIWDEVFAKWDVWHLPLTGSGGAYVQDGYTSIVAAIRDTDDRHGPLRSLRVLYDNGYELHVATYEDVAAYYEWRVTRNDTGVAWGEFDEDTDSEAVERAMIAAAAYFTQAQGLDT